MATIYFDGRKIPMNDKRICLTVMIESINVMALNIVTLLLPMLDNCKQLLHSNDLNVPY